MTIPPISLGLIKGAELLKSLHAEMFSFGQAHGLMNKSAEHTSVHALAGRLQAGPSGNLELTVPSSLIKGVFDALDEPGAEFVVRNNRTESAIKVMTKEEVDKLGGTSHITERGHSYHYTLGPIVELPATGDYDKLWAISIKSDDLEDIRKSYGLETSPQLGFYIPVGCKKKKVTEDNKVSKLSSLVKESAGPVPKGTVGGSNPSGRPKSNVATSNVREELAKQPTQYSSPNRFPTSQPGPNYERGDSAKGGWSSIPGWLEKNRPLPEEAPLGNTSADLAMLTPAAPVVGALTQAGIKSLPAATRFAAAGAPLNTAGGVAKGLWNAGTLKAVRNSHPYVGRGMAAANIGGVAAASYEPLTNAISSVARDGSNAIADARDLANTPGELLSKYLRQGVDQKTLDQIGSALPRIKEPAFTVRFGEGQIPNALNNYAADAAKRTAAYAGKYYGHYLGNPEGPLETALRYHTPARALSTQLFKAINNQTGAFNAQPPDYKSLGAAHALSFAGKALKNTAFPGSPGPSIDIRPNPLFAKEIISKTPGIPARFVSPMLGLKKNNLLTRWADEQGTRLANGVIKQPFGANPTPVLPELEEYLKRTIAPASSVRPPNVSNIATKRVGEL